MARHKNNRAVKGNGSIRQRKVKRKDGTSYISYELRYSLGKDENGNERRRSESFRTKAEAEARQLDVAANLKKAKLYHWSQTELETALHPGKCKDALTEASVIEQNDLVQTEKEVTEITLDEWFEEWVSSSGDDWAESTKTKYRQDYHRYISPRMGKFAVKDIRRKNIQEMISTWKNPKFAIKKTLSPKYIRDLYSMLKSCFSAALEEEIISSNPCTKTKLGKVSKNKQVSERLTISLEQLQQLITVISSAPHSNFYLFSAFFGLRVMENLGLTINDIDMDNHVIKLRYQLRRNFDEVPRTDEKETKHYKLLKDKDFRDIYFGDQIAGILQAQIIHERLKKERLGDKWPSAELERGDLLFSNDSGYYLSYSTIRDCFYRRARKIVPGIRVHDLRHIYVMIAKLSGVPMDMVSEHLGHASSDFTKRVYLPDAPAEIQRKSAEMIGNTVSMLRSNQGLRADTFFGNKSVEK